MEYRTFGRTGREVSRLGFGGATAGLKNYLRPFDPANPDDRQPIIEAVHVALEKGVTYFDTAPGYGNGASESIFGEALQGTPPEKVFLATKVGSWGKSEARESLEPSLKRLRRDYVDLLQIHGTHLTHEHEKRILQPGGLLDQMEKLKDEGLIRHIGFTGEAENPPLYNLIRTGRFDSIQMCYNLLFQHPYDPGWKSGSLYEAKEQNMGIAVMRSTTSGIFQKWVQKVNPENTFDYTSALIQYQYSCPFVDVVLVGMRSAERVLQNIAIADDLDGRVDIEGLFNRYV